MRHRRCFVLACALLFTQPLQAQISSGGEGALFRSDAAGTRVEQPYAPKPIRIGPLIAEAGATLRAAGDSNVRSSAVASRSELVLVAQPFFRARSDRPMNAFGIDVRGRFTRFSSTTRENSDEYEARVFSRIDFTDQSELSGRIGLARQVEERGEAGLNNPLSEPISFRLAQSALAGKAEFGRLQIRAGLTTARRDYAALRLVGGTLIDQSFRDTRSLAISARAAYQILPGGSVFVGGAVNDTISLKPRSGLARDATGEVILAGIRADLGALVVGEIGAGWRRQTYKNPLFSDYNGPTYDATIDWYPTPLISFRVQAGQDFINSGIPGVPGILTRELRLKVFHDPLRNLRFGVALLHQRDRYRELKLRTNTFTTEVSGEYIFGPRLTATAFVRHRDRQSTDAVTVTGYGRTVAGVSLTGYL